MSIWNIIGSFPFKSSDGLVQANAKVLELIAIAIGGIRRD
jgi:hypothetical protein